MSSCILKYRPKHFPNQVNFVQNLIPCIGRNALRPEQKMNVEKLSDNGEIEFAVLEDRQILGVVPS